MKRLKSYVDILGVSLVLALILLGITSHEAKATFIIDPTPDGDKFYLDKAGPVSSFTGEVGSQGSGVLVSVVTTGDVDTANGYANIKPADSTLTDLTFTPADGNLFGDFSFRGQLDNAGNVTVKVWDNQGSLLNPFTFTFAIANANQNFDRIGIISTDGETISKVEILNDSFKEVKEIDFSYTSTDGGDGQINVVPEPSTMILLGSGLLMAGGAGRRRFLKK